MSAFIYWKFTKSLSCCRLSQMLFVLNWIRYIISNDQKTLKQYLFCNLDISNSPHYNHYDHDHSQHGAVQAAELEPDFAVVVPALQGERQQWKWHQVTMTTRSSWLNCALRDDEAVYWVSLGHSEASAVGNWWYWVSKGHACLYILHKVEIWAGVTHVWQTDWQLWKIVLLSSL